MKKKPNIIWIIGCAAAAFLAAQDARGDLKHRYSFNESGGTEVSDSVSGADGTVVNTTGGSQLAGGELTLGNDGSQASNAGTGDYVDLPNGLISDLVGADDTTSFTLEAWFTWNGSGSWQRVWDIGTSVGGEDVSDSGDATAQIFTTPQSDGGARAAWRGQGLGEASITAPAPVPAGEEQHFAFVWDEENTSASFYINGSLIGQNDSTTITIADNYAGNDVNVWLGRSQWPDTLFVGSYNEFRIWDNTMDALDVAEQFLGGPDNPDGGDLGGLTAVTAQVASNSIIVDESTTLRVLADYEQFTGINVAPLASHSSNNESVATVSPSGVITGVAEGTAMITSEYEGMSSSVSIEVTIPPLPEAVLAHRYSFGEAAGATVLEDLVGDADGEAINLAFTGSGSADFFAGSMAYVNLPNGIISSMENATVEAWTTFDPTGGGWQRVFDFGNTTLGEDPDPVAGGYNGDASWFFAPRQGGITTANGGRYAFDPGPGGENPQINPGVDGAAPIGEEFHTVAIYNYAQRSASIWINGVNIGEAAVPADRPLTTLDDVNNWLGRSQWSGDAFATANFNEFRIYEGVLTPLQIALNNSTGPDQIVDDPGDVVSLSMGVETTDLIAGGPAAAVSLNADFTEVSDVNVTAHPGAMISSSNNQVAIILQNPPRVVPVRAGTAEITGSLDGEPATPITVTVTANPSTPVLANRYSFNGDAADSVGSLDGELFGSGAIENGAATFDGSTFVDLPEYLFSDYYFNTGLTPALSFEVYGHWDGGPVWQRIFDFGSNTLDVTGPEVGPDAYNGITYLFLTPNSGGGQLMFTFANGTEEIDLPGQPLDAGQDFYVAVVFDPELGVVRLYRNGVLQSVAPIPPDALLAINDINIWLGRSNFSGDPFYTGTISEFRVWEGALSADEVAQHAACGPDDLDCEIATEPPPLSISQAGGDVTIAWPDAAGVVLESTSALGAGASWQTVGQAPQANGGMSEVTVTPTGTAYYRLRAGN